MGVAEYRTWNQLVLQDEQAQEIVARVKAEEIYSKPRPDKPTWRAPESSSQPKRRDTLQWRISQSEEVWLQAMHVPINYIPSRMSTWSFCLSNSKWVTNSNCQRSDVLKRWERLMILTTTYIRWCWGTIPRIVISSRMFFRLWLMRRYLSSVQSRRRWLLTW